MRRFFGSSKAAPPPEPAPSLADASGKLDARIADLDVKIARCEDDVKKYMAKQAKQLAVQTMKRKKMYEQQREQLLGQQFNLDALAGAQEQAQITMVTAEAMKSAHADLKQRHSQMGGVTDIEKLMDDMADLNDEMAEIQKAMATNFTAPEGFDEAECEAELAALEEEMALATLAGVPSSAAAAEPPVSLPEAKPAAIPAEGGGPTEGGGYGSGGGSGGAALPVAAGRT